MPFQSPPLMFLCCGAQTPLFPPITKAKRSPSWEAPYRSTAFPEIKGESPDDLLYTWSVNAESQVRNVLGEQEFSFTVMKNTSSVFVSVEVSTLNQSFTASKALNISLAKPHILLDTPPFFFLPGGKIDLAPSPTILISQARQIFDTWSFGAKSILGIPPDPTCSRLPFLPTPKRGRRRSDVVAENLKTPEKQGGHRLK